jgi:hypothetical protein
MLTDRQALRTTRLVIVLGACLASQCGRAATGRGAPPHAVPIASAARAATEPPAAVDGGVASSPPEDTCPIPSRTGNPRTGRVEAPIPFVRDLILGKLEDPKTGGWGGTLTVLDEDTVLYRAAGSAERVAMLNKCDVVTAVQGDRWVWPQRVVVVFPQRGYAVGEEFFVLAAEEEGFRAVWHAGEFGTFDFLQDQESQDKQCKTPSKSCWLCFGPEARDTWWFQVVARDGTKGWSKDPDRFSNTKPCRR